MSSINKVMLIGNLGKDPEVRNLDSGKSVANFSIATSESYKNKQGEKVTNTEWHNIVLWSPLAEIAEKYLKKGSKVYLEGKLTSRSYESDNTTKYVAEVVCREMKMLDGKNSSQGEASGKTFDPNENTEDDLPF